MRSLNRYFRFDLYRRLLPYTRPYHLLMTVVVILMLVQSAIALLEPWPMKLLVDSGLGSEPLSDWLTQLVPPLQYASRYAIVVFAVLAGLGLWLVSTALSIVTDHLKSRVNEGLNLAFRADLFAHLQRLSFTYHDRTTVGDSLYRLTNDTSFISTLVWGNFRHLLTAGVSLVGMIWIVAWMDWQLALIALAVTPLLYGAVGLSGRYFKDRSKQLKAMESGSHTILQEVLSCLRVVKAFGREDAEQRRYERASWSALRARLRLSLEQSLFSSTLGFITKVDRALVLLIGAFHVIEGRLTIGELLVILTYVSQIHGPLETIGETLNDMQLSLASAERTMEVFDTEPMVQERPGAKSLPVVNGAVTLEDVAFSYGGPPVLQGIDIQARPAEVVAIVGPTGAGKTTIASLIARFYDPTAGKVTLDGYDVRDLTIETLRQSIAVVLQEPILFTGTIRDNIAYGAPGAPLDDIVSAARAANAHEFILALPEGYDTQVGERGVRLSGGERQRIAIARAFLKNAPVLILDEPTSSVDARTEATILTALNRLMAGRSTFVIAHRLSTIRQAHQILVVDRGRIVERGAHDDLIERGGLYAQLYRIQLGEVGQRERMDSAV